jgi:hypothetical protein
VCQSTQLHPGPPSPEATANGVSSGPPLRDFVEIGPQKTSFPGDAEEAKAHFQQFHAIGIRSLLEPSFLNAVVRVCDSVAFGPGRTDAPGFREVELSPQRAGRLLNLAVNRPAFLRWLEEITGCEPLREFGGRLTQTLNRPGDELLWHDDFLEREGRRLALVLNLSTQPFDGGEFALRRKGQATIFEHKYTTLGSALIFEVNQSLEHRVQPLTSGGPRRVFAGWAFRAGVQ